MVSATINIWNKMTETSAFFFLIDNYGYMRKNSIWFSTFYRRPTLSFIYKVCSIMSQRLLKLLRMVWSINHDWRRVYEGRKGVIWWLIDGSSFILWTDKIVWRLWPWFLNSRSLKEHKKIEVKQWHAENAYRLTKNIFRECSGVALR